MRPRRTPAAIAEPPQAASRLSRSGRAGGNDVAVVGDVPVADVGRLVGVEEVEEVRKGEGKTVGVRVGEMVGQAGCHVAEITMVEVVAVDGRFAGDVAAVADVDFAAREERGRQAERGKADGLRLHVDPFRQEVPGGLAVMIPHTAEFKGV